MNSSDTLVRNDFAPWLPFLHTVLWICFDNTDSPCCVCKGAEALDECGLRYLLAMRLHTCLLTSLPPLYRMQLLHQGKKKFCLFYYESGDIYWLILLFIASKVLQKPLRPNMRLPTLEIFFFPDMHSSMQTVFTGWMIMAKITLTIIFNDIEIPVYETGLFIWKYGHWLNHWIPIKLNWKYNLTKKNL